MSEPHSKYKHCRELARDFAAGQDPDGSGGSGGFAPRIGIVFGSASDWPTMKAAVDICERFGVPAEFGVVSAHRTPDRLRDYARLARSRGLHVVVAGAGGAAHLPGMLAAWTNLPVFGVPVKSRALSGIDSLLSIAQMPGGVPVGTLAIGDAGARNAALLALRVVAIHDDALAGALDAFSAQQAAASLAAPLDLHHGE